MVDKVLVLGVAALLLSYAGSAVEGRDYPAMDTFFSRLVGDVSKGGDGQSDALESSVREMQGPAGLTR